MAVYELATAVKQRMLENDAAQIATSSAPATPGVTPTSAVTPGAPATSTTSP
jgi:hypothetical protein